MKEFRTELDKDLTKRCQDIRDEVFAKAGKFGSKKNLPKDPETRPKISTHKKNIRPYVCCSDRVLRQVVLSYFQSFWKRHDHAVKEVKLGHHDVEFPSGSYWWDIHAGMKCSVNYPAWLRLPKESAKSPP